MPTPVFPTAYEVEVRGMLFGQQIENVWHVQGPDPFDALAAATIAGIFQVAYGTILGAFSENWTVGEVFVHNFGGVASGEFTLAITPPMTGAIASNADPGNVAFCTSLRSALSGRQFRGRKYFSGLAKSEVDNNAWDPVRIAILLSAIADLITALNAAGFPLSIFSKTHSTLVPVLTATAVDPSTDSQRRRLNGRGR